VSLSPPAEQRRVGSDLRLQFDGNVVLGYDPGTPGGSENDRRPERSFQEGIHIYRESWVRLLSQVSTATSLRRGGPAGQVNGTTR